MRTNEVILLDDVDHLGREGQVVKVARGYARNFLVPRKLAVPVTDGNLRELEERRKVQARREERFAAEAQGWADKIAGKTIEYDMQSAQAGRLYGSVNARMIAESLKELTGLEIDKRMIELAQPLRQLGTFDIPVRFTEKIRALVKVTLTGPEPEVTEAPEAAPAPAVEPEPEAASDAEPLAEESLTEEE